MQEITKRPRGRPRAEASAVVSVRIGASALAQIERLAGAESPSAWLKRLALGEIARSAQSPASRPESPQRPASRSPESPSSALAPAAPLADLSYEPEEAPTRGPDRTDLPFSKKAQAAGKLHRR